MSLRKFLLEQMQVISTELQPAIWLPEVKSETHGLLEKNNMSRNSRRDRVEKHTRNLGGCHCMFGQS